MGEERLVDKEEKNEVQEEEEEEEGEEEGEEEKGEEEEEDDDDQAFKCISCQKTITGQRCRFPRSDGDPRSGQPSCRGCLGKAKAKAANEKCFGCQKTLTGRMRRFPQSDGDERSGQPCCGNCQSKAKTEAANEKCVGCEKTITGPRCRFLGSDGDARNGQPCCEYCHQKAITEAIVKKNFDDGKYCENCKSLEGIQRGGRYEVECDLFGGSFWKCESCVKSVHNRNQYHAKLEKEGKPPPRFNKKRKYKGVKNKYQRPRRPQYWLK